MVGVPSFKVERWMDTWEQRVQHDLAETCSDSISLAKLVELSKQDGAASLEQSDFFNQRCGYGHIDGSPELRGNIAKLYQDADISAEDVLITQGAIGANMLLLLSLVGPTSHIVCMHPTYQQLYAMPSGLGARVSLWSSTPDVPLDVAHLDSLLEASTDLVILNNPQNPTGRILTTEQLRQVIQAVKKKCNGAVILCDEVYRPLFHSLPEGAEPPSSIIEAAKVEDYEHVVASGSLSKAYSLAGLRIGWLTTPSPTLLQNLKEKRDYTTISVSGLDDHLAARALAPEARRAILQRNLALARTNRALVADVVERCGLKWTEPVAGTTALIYLGDGVDDVKFCTVLAEKYSCNVVPASMCFDTPLGWVRMGYVGSTAGVKAGLEVFERALTEYKQSASSS